MVADADLERLIAHEAAYFDIWSQVTREEGVWYLDGRLLPDYQSANRAIRLRARSEAEAEDIVGQVIAHFRGRNLPAIADLDPIAARQGFGVALRWRGFRPVSGHVRLMRYEGKALSTEPMAVGEIEPHPEIGVALHHIPNETGNNEAAEYIDLAGCDESEVEDARFWRSVASAEARHPSCRLYIARLIKTENEAEREQTARAVGTCLLFSADGWAQIDSVMTHPDYRRRGIASALVRLALRDSLALGNEITYLNTDQGGPGEKVYERLGFKTWGVGILHRHILW